jgi:uncharacterized protein YukE
MKRIQIEPDELRNFSRMMVHNVNLMLDEEFKLRRAISCLDMDWHGGGSVEFMEEANTLQLHLHSRIDEFYELARRLNREADRWEESDQTWVQQYRDLWAAKTKPGG